MPAGTGTAWKAKSARRMGAGLPSSGGRPARVEGIEDHRQPVAGRDHRRLRATGPSTRIASAATGPSGGPGGGQPRRRLGEHRHGRPARRAAAARSPRRRAPPPTTRSRRPAAAPARGTRPAVLPLPLADEEPGEAGLGLVGDHDRRREERPERARWGSPTGRWRRRPWRRAGPPRPAGSPRAAPGRAEIDMGP